MKLQTLFRVICEASVVSLLLLLAGSGLTVGLQPLFSSPTFAMVAAHGELQDEDDEEDDEEE
ncbi:MAG: hypothetical protein AAEJ04_01765, partial [Planctomycetota bacterium]